MSSKRWFIILPAAILLAICCCAVFRILTGPFGVFGDPVPDQCSGSETDIPETDIPETDVPETNVPETSVPRIDKLAWLDERYEQYDSYVIGSSSASSYSVEELNGYLDASFCDLSAYCSDLKDYRDFAAYVLEYCTVENIILNLGLNEAARRDDEVEVLHGGMYALMYSGRYVRQMRDVEKIGDLAVYEAAHQNEFPDRQGSEQLPRAAECAQVAAGIRDMCEERGVDLIVILSPACEGQWKLYDEAALRACRTALAGAVDYWDFSCTPISFDSRYFYDPAHFRGAVGTMVLAEIFGNDDVYRPERFGTRVTADNCQAYLDELFADPPRQEMDCYTADVPVLLYHHIDENPTNSLMVTPETFEEQMRFLAENGYHTVTIRQMIDYVYHGGDLPDKPVCVTFDDGYLSNYEYAWPILERYGLNAVVYAIGVSVGHDRYYKDTQFELIPHFSFEQAREMIESGVIDVQSHTYDMHQWAPVETGDQVRETIVPLDGESGADYVAALNADIERYAEIARQELGGAFLSLAYPKGQYTALTEVLVHQAGIPVTMSTRTDSRNVLVRGLPQSLYALCRWYVTEETTQEELLAVLNG